MGGWARSRLSSAALWYLERMHVACYRRQLVFYCRRPGEPAEEQGAPGGYDLQFIGPGDLERLHYPGGWLTLGEAQEWMRRGDSDLLAAICDGRICAYMWVEKKVARIDYLKLESALPEGHIYLSKVLVVPGHRKRGLARAMYRHVMRTFPDATAHSACVTENLPMQLLFGSLAWQVRLLLWVWQLGPIHWCGIEYPSSGRRLLLTRSSAAERLFVDVEGAALPGLAPGGDLQAS